jgi:hypothetical protein
MTRTSIWWIDDCEYRPLEISSNAAVIAISKPNSPFFKTILVALIRAVFVRTFMRSLARESRLMGPVEK